MGLKKAKSIENNNKKNLIGPPNAYKYVGHLENIIHGWKPCKHLIDGKIRLLINHLGEGQRKSEYVGQWGEGGSWCHYWQMWNEGTVVNVGTVLNKLTIVPV